jgi:hypothetical protein
MTRFLNPFIPHKGTVIGSALRGMGVEIDADFLKKGTFLRNFTD